MGSKSNFICGTCINNDDGFCDFLGIYVESDDAPSCEYGKGWESVDGHKEESER